jgi:hypothetical protein
MCNLVGMCCWVASDDALCRLISAPSNDICYVLNAKLAKSRTCKTFWFMSKISYMGSPYTCWFVLNIKKMVEEKFFLTEYVVPAELFRWLCLKTGSS